jgi:hypothetical protein
MPVSVHRDVDVRVAEVMLDRLGMDAAADEHRRARVTQVVDPELMRQSGPFESWPPHSASEVRNTQRVPPWRSKDQRIVIRLDALEMEAQALDEERGNGNVADAVGLGLPEMQDAVDLGK